MIPKRSRYKRWHCNVQKNSKIHISNEEWKEPARIQVETIAIVRIGKDFAIHFADF